MGILGLANAPEAREREGEEGGQSRQEGGYYLFQYVRQAPGSHSTVVDLIFEEGGGSFPVIVVLPLPVPPLLLLLLLLFGLWSVLSPCLVRPGRRLSSCTATVLPHEINRGGANCHAK